MPYMVPDELYTANDLLKGYDRLDDLGFTRSVDFGVYQRFIADGAETPRSLSIRREQADHDAHISDALRRFLDQSPKPKLVGVMGGHSLSRAHPSYVAVARLGRFLATRGYLVVTGGGPGAMEAAHLGVCFANANVDALDRALAVIGNVMMPPVLKKLVAPDGSILPGHEESWKAARNWMNAALDARALAPSVRPPSLAIPTWFYGDEPIHPFASHYAKYFQNSIREESLIIDSRAGIVYAQGGGGTLREIFQDAEQNFYTPTAADFTPMIFFDPDWFWQSDAIPDGKGNFLRRGIRVEEMLTRMFRYAREGQKDAADCLAKMRFTTNLDEIGAILDAHAAAAQRNLMLALASKPLDIPIARINRVAPRY